jgi:hypothetical protein
MAGTAVAHVSNQGNKCTWSEAKDYLARGENAKRVPRPEGHTKG